MLLEENLQFDFAIRPAVSPVFGGSLREQLMAFNEFGKETQYLETTTATPLGERTRVSTFVNEYWTSKQRAANSLHEISYRACFKPQLPRFFIERLTLPGEVVYDPFMGRGTTPIETALLGRVPFGCDVNPLSVFLTSPRLRPPTIAQVTERLSKIDFANYDEFPENLLVFYHPDTLKEICALKKFLLDQGGYGRLDLVDQWIWMVALNRLTGHSPGFFSVYTLPPNQAVSVQSQKKINEARQQTPPRRYVAELIARKTKQLLSDCDGATRNGLLNIAAKARLVTGQSSSTSVFEDGTVSLVVTSPPFLDVVDYATDNWLRCWFIGSDANSVRLTVPRRIEDWQKSMTEVFRELYRVLRDGGHVAFEVGEIRGGKLKLEEAVLPVGIEVGLKPILILINDQKFTKTANCWGVENNSKGTNTNRVIVFRKPSSGSDTRRLPGI